MLICSSWHFILLFTKEFTVPKCKDFIESIKRGFGSLPILSLSSWCTFADKTNYHQIGYMPAIDTCIAKHFLPLYATQTHNIDMLTIFEKGLTTCMAFIGSFLGITPICNTVTKLMTKLILAVGQRTWRDSHQSGLM